MVIAMGNLPEISEMQLGVQLDVALPHKTCHFHPDGLGLDDDIILYNRYVCIHIYARTCSLLYTMYS